MGTKFKILVIDDEIDIQRLIVELLNDEGYDVSSADDGETGIKKVKEIQPDLVVLDWQLPDMEGVDVLRIIKNDSTTMHIPVIMCTSLGSSDNKIKGLETGADDYVTKPFNSSELIARVKVALRRVQREEKIIEARIAQLQKFLPKEMLDKIIYGPKFSEGERRIVTVLFADLTGFTSMAEQMDPEDVKKVVNECFKGFVEAINMYGGVIDKFIGDAIMALFGIPITHEDDPQRALKTALMMLYKLQEFNKTHAELPQKLQIRIGINTGEVVAGEMGSETRSEYTVMGDTVNVASRLQTIAQPNQIVISEETYKYSKNEFVFYKLPSINVKGKQDALNIYELKGAKYLRYNFISVNNKISPYIIPEREYNFTKNFIDRIKDVSVENSHNGYAVSITGQYGFGKSRLMYELSKYVQQLGIRYFEFRCLPYGQQGSMVVVYDVKENKFVNTGIKQVLVEILKNEPLIIFLEDLNYANATLLTLFESIVDLCETKQLLVITTSLPDTQIPWSKKNYFREIMLPEMTIGCSNKLLDNLLGENMILKNVKDIILQNAEGVPLFVEALVNNLIETRAILNNGDGFSISGQINKIDIPQKIYVAVMCQVDQLDIKTKEVLQIASAIGRDFKFNLLKYLYPEENVIKESIAKLIKKKILVEKTLLPERIYSFN